ncbi:MAG TPA: glycerol-3-phosphate dehydrogenase/oxidase [Cyclobacteriaceae bacterium]|nr:glycerol-3-phosphate dehydrogenase/oxidase [Cyclobacteriaceae bacterium]
MYSTVLHSKMFSHTTRTNLIKRLQTEPFDLLVIGGGITGAGIALDAASRGLKTALVEKHDFAFGTSSRSTKLIHGGLRYLKQLEFGLVREVGSERAVVHQLAPHLVLPEKMLLPLYEKRGFGSILTSFGLKLYDWLAGVKPEDQRKMLTRKQTLKAEPLLQSSDIKGGAIYAEYRTDDARLTIEIVKTAFRNSAVPVNYCVVTNFNYEDQKITGATIRDDYNNTVFNIKAKTIVNAAGPWVDELRELDNSKKGKRLHLTKGVHIVVPKEKLPVRQAIYFDVGDGRMIFAIPRDRITYIGTTDTNYSDSKEEVRASKDDATYLVNAVNQTFSSKLTVSDIESSWAGLRPLIHEEGKSASELSRKDEIFESDSNLISIAGGKLTGYRKMAERVVDLVIEKYFEDRELKRCYTASIPLTNPGFSSYGEVEVFKRRFPARLVHTYGRATEQIVANASSMDLLLAELEHCMEHEMVVSASDFFIRRTGSLFFNIDRMENGIEPVLQAMKDRLGWSEDKVKTERQRLKDSIKLSGQFL